jgi:hypothetical protein
MRLVAYVAEISLQLLVYILVNVDLLVNVYDILEGSASSFFEVETLIFVYQTTPPYTSNITVCMFTL